MNRAVTGRLGEPNNQGKRDQARGRILGGQVESYHDILRQLVPQRTSPIFDDSTPSCGAGHVEPRL